MEEERNEMKMKAPERRKNRRPKTLNGKKEHSTN